MITWRAAAVLGGMVFGWAPAPAPARPEQEPSRPAQSPSPAPGGRPPSRPGGKAEEPSLTAEAAESGRWSTSCDPEAVRRLGRGDLRLALSLQEYDPPRSGASTLVVSVVSADGKTRHVVDRFAPTPNRPFRATARKEPQRFQFDLSKHRDLLEAGRLTVEVGFDPKRGPAEGGRAEFTASLVAID